MKKTFKEIEKLFEIDVIEHLKREDQYYDAISSYIKKYFDREYEGSKYWIVKEGAIND